MAKRRMLDTRFWSDNFIVELNPLDRYLFLYFLTNEHTNICGIYELPIKRISDETGIEKDMVVKMLKRLSGKVAYVNGWVAIKNFSKYQSDNESVRIGAEKAKSLIPSHILQRIDTLWQGGDRVGTPPDISESESESESELESEPKLKSKSAETSSALVEEIIKTFEKVDAKNKTYYGNTTQRKACSFLIGEYGMDMILRVVGVLPETNKLPYFPSITSPYDLKEKWVKLGDAVAREKKEKDSKLKTRLSNVIW